MLHLGLFKSNKKSLTYCKLSEPSNIHNIVNIINNIN